MKNKIRKNNQSMQIKTSRSIYHPLMEKQWTGVNWSKVEKSIENLQHRITKAMERSEEKYVTYSAS